MPTSQQLRELAEQYLADAKVLRDAGRFDGAVYMCGYVLEAALKARICRHLQLADYPPDGFGKEFKTHNFHQLSLLAGLGDSFPQRANANVKTNWSIVADWLPDWRYRAPKTATQQKADSMIKALAEGPDGLLTWLK